MSEMEPYPPPSAPLQPAGWYPDGAGQLAWWDGGRWTEHRAPVPQQVYAQPMPQFPTRIVTKVPAQRQNTFHLLMTLLTCGLWLPFWLLDSIIKSMKKDKHVTKLR